MEDVLDNEIEMDEVLEMGSGAIGYDEAIESPVPRGALKVLLPGDDVMGLEEHKVGGGPDYRCTVLCLPPGERMVFAIRLSAPWTTWAVDRR